MEIGGELRAESRVRLGAGTERLRRSRRVTPRCLLWPMRPCGLSEPCERASWEKGTALRWMHAWDASSERQEPEGAWPSSGGFTDTNGCDTATPQEIGSTTGQIEAAEIETKLWCVWRNGWQETG